MEQIPFFSYSKLFEHRKEEYQAIINDVLSRGAFIMQEELLSFEKNLAKYLNVKYAIGMADGTMSLLASLMSSGIGKNDEVIVPSHTFVASAAAIHHLGAKPVLIDCKRDHLIDHNKIENLINEKTKAIMPVQLNGRVTNMDPIQQIAENYNLIIIEDSCQALGAKYNDKFAGTFGAAGTFSFFPAKTLGCFGDGGAIITNEKVIADTVKMIRDHGRDPSDGKAKLFGYNARLDNLHAAILDFKLTYYDKDIERRREFARIYQDRLKNIDSLLLPPGPDQESKHFDIYQNYEIEAKNRDELRQFLADKGIGTIIQWGGYALHQFQDLQLTGELSYTQEMTKKFMLLPMHSLLKESEVEYICEQIINFYE